MPGVFAVKGFLLDVSRDRVPTIDTLARLVRLLARCGYNQLELYMEHTFAHEGHEVVWRDASATTADQMRWLDRLCAEHGIRLVANRNCLGHMDRWLEHGAYRGPGHRGAELLVRTGLLVRLLRTPVGNSTVLFHKLFDYEPIREVPADGLAEARAELGELLHLADDLPAAGWVDEVRTSLLLAEVALDRIEGHPRAIPDALVHEVRRNWLATSRPGGLEDSLRRAHRVAPTSPRPAGPSDATGYWAGLVGTEQVAGGWPTS